MSAVHSKVYVDSCSEEFPGQHDEQACQSQAVALADPSQAAELAEKASAEKAEYDRLKLEIQTWTLATSIIGCSAAWLAYSWVSSTSAGLCPCNSGPSDWPVAAGSQFLCQTFGIHAGNSHQLWHWSCRQLYLPPHAEPQH